jgi:hypothetical protein
MEKYVAIIIPGLGEIERFSLLTSHWRKFHLEPVLHRVGWHGSEHFEACLAKIVARIDSFSTTGTKVSLIGCSAGGSAALNAFLERKNTVHKVISLCGWLRVGEHRKYLERLKYISASFVESVTLLDRREKELSSLLMLPMASRIAYRPFILVCDRNASPLALTASSTAWLRRSK